MKDNRILICSMLFLAILVFSPLTFAWTQPTDPVTEDWSTHPVNDMPPDYLAKNPEVANLIPPSRINELPPDSRNAYVQVKFPGVTANLGTGNIQLDGNILTVAGTTIDLSQMAGRTVTVSGNDVLVDGQKFTNAENIGSQNDQITADNAQYFESGTTTLINAEGIKFSPNSLYVAKADSISYAGATSTKIVEFTGQSGTFSVKSADRVIVETMTFDKIVNSVFKVSSGNLMAASIECTKNNSQTKFPNLVAGTSAFITSNCDDNEKYHVDYRENANEIVFNLSANMTLTFQGAKANITFNASENASLIIRPNGVFAVKNGILSYITETFTEQLQGNCLDYSSVDIDFEKGFLKTTLYPFNNYKTGVFICPGARYNRIYKEKENSYSIYNIGKSAYYLVFDKNLQIFNDLLTSNKNRENYGFVTENISLNGNIEYDRYPEKNIFPAISVGEYNSLPLEWKNVYAGYDPAMRTAIAGQNKVSISAKNYNGTDDVLAEINSGYFNIKQIGSSRFAKFNKNMTYPDYVSEFRYNNEPVIKIENKKLIEITDDKMTILYSPNTDESAKFLEWLKLKLTLKELSDVIGKIFGTNNLQVEVS